jgi:hypothetical protein
MTQVVRGGQSMRVAGKKCMASFNTCRTGGRKTRKATRKTHRRGKRK